MDLWRSNMTSNPNPEITVDTTSFPPGFSYHRPNAKTKFYSTSFYPSILPHWNNLPESVVSLPKLSLFKEAMSKIILREGNQNQVI